MAVGQAAENHGDEWGLTWYFYEELIYQFQPKPTHKVHNDACFIVNIE